MYCTPSILGPDPPTVNRLNACSYQQSALTTYQNYQYAVFYTPKSKIALPDATTPRYVNLSRRAISPKLGSWETLTFTDYEQTTDDGHNTISMGISHGDGTIHLSFDHHCDTLRVRTSVTGLAKNPSQWSTSLFTSTVHTLPGISTPLSLFEEVSYPRFVNIGAELLLEYRIGKAGAGSDTLFHYSSITHLWSHLGTYLTGIDSNPYPHGLSYQSFSPNSPFDSDATLSRLHVTWTYRHYIGYPTSDSADSTAHKTQAGPNGPENNADLCYAYSSDGGRTWLNTMGNNIAVLDKGESILPQSSGVTVFKIPKGSGVLNQEAQCVDGAGRLHVLGRQKVEEVGRGLVERWLHYWREVDGGWKKRVLESFEPTEAGDRGEVCASGEGAVMFLLPGNGEDDTSLSLLRAWVEDEYERVEVLWKGEGFAGEPLVDLERLADHGVLSVFTRTAGINGVGKEVVVLDSDDL